MNPPKKIVLTHYDLQWLSETHQIIDPGTQSYEATFSGNTYEYHLAPVKDKGERECPFCKDTSIIPVDLTKELAEMWANKPVWHDAKTDPPKEDGEYLCIVLNGDYELLTWKSGSWFAWEYINYWMPLPEPPKEEK